MRKGVLLFGLVALLAQSPAYAQEWAIAGGGDNAAEDSLLAEEAALLEEMRKTQAAQGTGNSAPRARADIEDALQMEQQKLEQLKGDADDVRDSVIRMRGSDYDEQVVQDNSLKLRNSDQGSLSGDSRSQSAEMEQMQAQLDSVSGKLEAQNAKVSKLQRSNASLQGKLAVNRDKLAALKKELEEARNHLIVAEAEVSRLSRLLEERNRTSLMKYSGSLAKNKQPTMRASTPERVARPDPEPIDDFAGKATPDMTIATVTASKANLRTGPGLNNSPLMSVAKGTRLAVETRKGDWYRIIAPTGVRAWISSTVVGFGKTAHSSPTRTVSIKGYDSSIEQEAFQLIKKSAR